MGSPYEATVPEDSGMKILVNLFDLPGILRREVRKFSGSEVLRKPAAVLLKKAEQQHDHALRQIEARFDGEPKALV